MMDRETNFYDSFRSEKRFEDKAHFPYGFMKSGDFTIEQARILELKGVAYSELASGERKPKGEVEREFVAFCQGKKEAQTVHERIWQRYMARIDASMTAVSFNKKRVSEELYIDEAM